MSWSGSWRCTRFSHFFCNRLSTSGISFCCKLGKCCRKKKKKVLVKHGGKIYKQNPTNNSSLPQVLKFKIREKNCCCLNRLYDLNWTDQNIRCFEMANKFNSEIKNNNLFQVRIDPKDYYTCKNSRMFHNVTHHKGNGFENSLVMLRNSP